MSQPTSTQAEWADAVIAKAIRDATKVIAGLLGEEDATTYVAMACGRHCADKLPCKRMTGPEPAGAEVLQMTAEEELEDHVCSVDDGIR